MRKLLIGAGLAIILAAGAAWWLVPTRYEAYALLRVAARQPGVLTKGGEGIDEYQTFKRTQVQLILSPFVLQRTVAELEVSKLATIKEHQDGPHSWLKSQLIIDYPDDSEILRVAIKGTKPNELIKIVNAVVRKYLTDVVQSERLKRFAKDQELGKRYEEYQRELTRQMETLNQMERVAKVAGAEAAQVRKKLDVAKLDELLGRRARIRAQLDDNAMQIMLRKASEASETRTAAADPPAAAQPQGTLSLSQLTAQKEYLEKQLEEAEKDVVEQAEVVASLESFSANVAAKKEELQRLKSITNELGAELERSKVERMAMDRITKVDDAILDSPHGDIARKNVTTLAAATVGLALVAVGLVIPRRRASSGKRNGLHINPAVELN